jgi:ADP-ribosylglycohydrolase
MPGQGSLAGGDLTDDEILAVVCHERYTLGGADPASEEFVEEFENWCSEESPIYEALEAGTSLADLADAGVVSTEGEPIEMIPVGDAPAEGSPPE